MCEFIKVEHPTGDIFRGEIFRAIPDIGRYFEISDMFPENNVRHYMLLHGSGAYSDSKVYKYAEPRLIDFNNVKSGVENGKNLWDMYYAPRRNIIQHLELEDMIDNDCPGVFTEKETDIFFRSNMRMMILYTSLIWKERNEEPGWCAHYGQSIRHVETSEVISNIITSFRAVESHLQERGTLSPSRKKFLASYRTRSILYWRYYYGIKQSIKKILQPIGIWSILRCVKKCIKEIPRP